MKIIDCFIFYNELDLLKYRVDVYSDIIDYFIIVESRYTFSGNEKELYFENNKNEEIFEKNKEKIIHIILDKLPFVYPNIDYDKNQQWSNEIYQRNSIVLGLNKINNLKYDDLIIISDVDELPDYNFLKEVKLKNILLNINIPYSLKQDMYYYNLNTFIGEWFKSKILSFKLLNFLLENNITIDNIRLEKINYQVIDFLLENNITIDNIRLENINNINYQVIDKCGWHLSYFGDIYYIRNKLRNFSHQEFNNEMYTNIKYIKDKIENQVNLFDTKKFKNISSNENSYLPYKYEIYLKKYINN